jgi:hypothetical protein
MNVQKATKRTFYIERYGNEFRIIKVWEVGAEFTQKDMLEAFQRVEETSPDERIIAEQSVGIGSGPGGVVIEAKDQTTLDSTLKATEGILKDVLK